MAKWALKSTLGEGSTFWFEINLPKFGTNAKRKQIPVDVSGARVLVVDDNAVNRSILVENLVAWEFESAAAASSAEALAAIRAMQQQDIEPDCIILDYHMPEMNGAELTRVIRSDDAISHIPIIMLTSVDQMESGENFSSLGIQRHLVKPARSSVLLESVIAVLQEAKNSDSDIISGVAMARKMGGFTREPEETTEDPTVHNRRTEDTLDEAKAENLYETPDTDENKSLSGIQKSSVVSAIDEMREYADEGVDVLVAEDNEVNQIVFKQILEATGYSFVIANNGKEAVELYRQHKPRVICMDVSMPLLNGHEATAEIRSIERDQEQHTPVIGVTAHAINGDMERCFESGMDDYLSKPVSPEKLEEKIHKWINSSDGEMGLAAI